MTYIIELTAEEVNLIGACLGEQPVKVAVGLWLKLRDQCVAQDAALASQSATDAEDLAKYRTEAAE